MKGIVLSARRYSFAEQGTGRAVAGVTVDYIDPEAQGTPEPDRKGTPALQVSTQRPELWESITAVPGLYEMDFAQRPGKNNRPTLALVGLRFLESVNIAVSGNSKNSARA